ncbi:MAG: 2-vinyl bacteriochlorophyllide hydratase [Pseudomonadota bacterium]
MDGVRASNANVKRAKPLYTPDEQRRRDETVWTLVQGILAPVQFIVFLVSFALVVRFLATGEGWLLATLSVIFKTLILYTIMITGSVWEKVVFGKYLFAGPFFWEDVVSILVLALHTAYLAAVIADTINRSFMDPQAQMLLALAAYAAYVINAAQFLLKLRAARLQRAEMPETALALQQVNTSTVTGQLPGVSS